VSRGRMTAPSARPAVTSRDAGIFARLPWSLYERDPLWVPPMMSTVRAELDESKNPFLEHCERELFLLERDGRVEGRIAAFVDRLALEDWQEPIGLFGYFECRPDDREGALALLGAARDWLRAKGMRRMRGPWSFVSQEWGLVVEGFSPEAVVMAPYNPPGYAALLEGFGLAKAMDLLCWEISVPAGYRIPDRILNLTDAVAKRHGITVRAIDLARYEEEVQLVVELTNGSIQGNWGFSRVTEREVEAMARDLRPLIRPECVLFAQDREGKEIGFAISIPDINLILKRTRGRMLPFGWARLLWGIPRLRRYRMFGLGVAPGWRGKAVDSLIYRAMWERMAAPDTTMEINYVLEDNWPMINAIAKLGAAPSRRYRVYETDI
jgi:hypothetical protein